MLTPTKVLFLPRSFGAGGAEITAARLLPILQSSGIVCAVAASPAPDGLGSAFDDATAPLLEMHDPGRQPLQWCADLLSILKDYQPDVIHTFAPLPAALARLTVKLLRPRPQAAFVHREPSPWTSFPAPVRALNSWTYGFNSAAFAVSENVLHSMTPRARARTSVLLHGLDTRGLSIAAYTAEEARQLLGLGSSSFNVVSIGSLKPQKDYPTVIQAAAALHLAGVDFHWHIFGEGSERPLLQKMIRRHGLSKCVTLEGHVPAASLTLRGFDVYVSASSTEGLPVAPMEAITLGTEAILSDIPAHRHLQTLCRRLRVFPVHEPLLLARALMDLASSGHHAGGHAPPPETLDALDIGRAARVIAETYESVRNA